MRTKRSWVWEQFCKSDDGQSATCRLCDVVMQAHGSTTTLSHLIRIHSLGSETQRKRRQQELQNEAYV